ncbi:hypothetical protein [Synechococcus sp. FACHB-909]|uniref:hypothetical protein n=1 Tax=Synechococcus sp. FACHB-909 TaxID=2692863 RepID=UPI001684F6E0|nr:hypothetical protein [Synechococcus sp. FACHB-909]MBD2717998.1 hypothetical protein [Synechococcus sp. FACHB-909]
MDEETFSRLLEHFQLSKGNQGDQGAQRAALRADYKSIARFYSTCVHEFTHWLDHTSTLWGQRQLVLIYNAISAWTNQDEYDFYRIAIANSERHRARLALYYTEEYEVSQQDVQPTPWRYSYGSGLEFGIDGRPRADRPFVFTVFSNSNDQRIIRVPFSMFALTEATATYAEFKVKSQSLALLDDDSRLVEQIRLEQEFLQNLYDPKLVIYSMVTHCLANSIQVNDAFRAYEYSSALATLCLNLPKELFHNLLLPEEFNVWGDRVQALKELSDPGFAFFAIAQQAPTYRSETSVELWLQEAVTRAGLPSLDSIESLAIARMKELDKDVIKGIYADQANALLSIGRENFEQRGVWGRNVLSMENLYNKSIVLPPVVLGDGCITPVVPTRRPASLQPIEDWIDQMINIEVSVDQFVRACRF